MLKKLFSLGASAGHALTPIPTDADAPPPAELAPLPESLLADSPYGIGDFDPANATLHAVDAVGVRSCYTFVEEGPEETFAAVRYRVDEGTVVWIEDKRAAWAYQVESVVRFDGWSRLSLVKCHVERRRLARRETDIDARLSWSSEGSSGEAAASIQNMSATGVQVYTSGELPIGATVELSFNDVQRTGSVQWSSISPVGCVSGLRLDAPITPNATSAGRGPTLGDQLRDLDV